MGNQYNVLIDCVGVLLVGAILIAERGQKHRGDPLNIKLLHGLMLCCTVVFLLDIPGLLLDGWISPGARALLWFFDTAYWALQTVYCYLWLLFADYWVYGSRKHLKRRALIYALPMFIELLLVFSTPFTGWVFTLDELNVYARGRYYLYNMLPYVLYIVSALTITINGYRQTEDPERKRRMLSLVVYMFLPIVGVVFDCFVYGISWVWPMVALSLLMVYLNVQQQYISEEQLSAARMETKLSDSRMAVMLSQIQPHFLYNALGTIQRLCRIDPAMAEKATAEFSMFLRGNMDSLTMDKPIGFALELEHTRHYLSLEELRFPERLRVSWDIQTELFRLPTLTLQPIVENAVRYGVTRREEGGTVRISSRETDSAFIVTVEDDGVGFDPMLPHADGRTHIGIQNVRERLFCMCGGTLDIQSISGIGTTATITIPKGEA